MLIESNSLNYGYIIKIIFFPALAYSYSSSFAEIMELNAHKLSAHVYFIVNLLFIDKEIKLRAVEKLPSFSKLQ